VAFQVAVCGPASCTDVDRAHAYRVGELLARRGAVVICGGGAGVMAAVAAGARSAGGLAVGVRPDGRDASGGADSGELSVTLATNLGQARNAVIVASADAVIAVGDSWGTLSEIALAVRRGGIPVVVLGGWRVIGPDGGAVPGPSYVESPDVAVTLATGGR